jgi:hypothetical protein
VSVLVLFKREGYPDEHLAYDRELAHPVPREQPRRISHTCARADDGIVIVDVWESAENFYEMMNDPVLGARKLQGGSRSHSSSRSTRCTLPSPELTPLSSPRFPEKGFQVLTVSENRHLRKLSFPLSENTPSRQLGE